MDEIELHELIDECKEELEHRAANLSPLYWLEDEDGNDSGEDYCHDCAVAEAKKTGQETFYHYPAAEYDGSRVCTECGALLEYTLTGCGVDYELDYFIETPLDWNSAGDCYCMARIAWGFWGDEQQTRFMAALLLAQNTPDVIAMQLTRYTPPTDTRPA